MLSMFEKKEKEDENIGALFSDKSPQKQKKNETQKPQENIKAKIPLFGANAPSNDKKTEEKKDNSLANKAKLFENIGEKKPEEKKPPPDVKKDNPFAGKMKMFEDTTGDKKKDEKKDDKKVEKKDDKKVEKKDDKKDDKNAEKKENPFNNKMKVFEDLEKKKHEEKKSKKII